MTKPDGTYPSTCWECSTRCGSLVTLENGHVTKVGPNKDHPGSKGAFCVKGIRALPELTYSENRIRSPMRRVFPATHQILLRRIMPIIRNALKAMQGPQRAATRV